MQVASSLQDKATATDARTLLTAMIRKGLLAALPARDFSKKTKRKKPRQGSSMQVPSKRFPAQLPWEAIEPTTAALFQLPRDYLHQALFRLHVNEVLSAPLLVLRAWLGGHADSGSLDLTQLSFVSVDDPSAFMRCFQRIWGELDSLDVTELVMPTEFQIQCQKHATYISCPTELIAATSIQAGSLPSLLKVTSIRFLQVLASSEYLYSILSVLPRVQSLEVESGYRFRGALCSSIMHAIQALPSLEYLKVNRVWCWKCLRVGTKNCVRVCCA